MDIIVPQHTVTRAVLGEQAPKADTRYRKIKYIVSFPVEEGLLTYNTLTGELLLLNPTEAELLSSPENRTGEELKALIAKWLLVPAEHDDLLLSRQAEGMMITINRSRVGIPQNNFVVLTTTDCNARCFYCYELSGNRRNMSAQTAADVAEYIIKKCDRTQPVVFRWFGGEPLYNAEAIDIICSALREAGISYHGNIITNAYLLDAETARRAKRDWHIDWVQITLDGTEEIYNRTKAFIYKNQGSAFLRVLDNIGNALEAGIDVHARLNMDDHNEDDLFRLTEILIKRFGKYRGFRIYSNLLFEEDGSHAGSHSAEERHALTEKQMKLRQFMSDSGHGIRNILTVKDFTTHCMADRDGSAVIMPDGNLGKCEYFTDGDYYGSIYSEKVDLAVINRYKNASPLAGEKCDLCELRPQCIQLESCPIIKHRCDEFDKKFLFFDMETKIRSAYTQFKKAKEK